MSIRVPEETASERTTRERFESEAMRRFPGVEFWWSNGERRAKLRDSGIEVWELIMLRRDNPHMTSADFARDWPHVSIATIESAIRYHEAFPDAVDARIARNDWYTEERVAEIAARLNPPA
jgi:uncharacterized protein (DUF433 family)